ncbi:Acetyltransferase (GNAT) domain-containing protein [Actinopolymorpha cephalotaxi]|uniref:8-oxo-dGTP pyrophosphatase MutT (NUDIX family) n=1 Tax=Actinopolymorpha cephalotaxi TaxID=504797 RepID=A0A1I2ZGR9_9ACTN|nr:NUDIX hydrolase [Actinopolymorpha cephalotaxi]NYH81986.1 8-oxo-dGTP pyrophosphatase MutT (NUDIX family) [Actinopolymorpha cephalotaxi]SFH37018.1 Acetyltransferase (GNAT) domain-containing protein [Actinopolymorpha cephalotaxi]
MTSSAPTPDPGEPAGPLTDGLVTLRPTASADSYHFAVVTDEREVGHVELRDLGGAVGELTWGIEEADRRQGYATRAVRLVTVHALRTLGLHRVQAEVAAHDRASLRIAARAGLRREGLLRAHRTAEGERHDVVVLARLTGDPEPDTHEGFIGLVNSSLPRTRLIAHVVIRDPQQRILLAQVTYKPDWELPGGVVEPFESPREGAARETWEEVGIELPIGKLLSVDWLPPWRGWDDAVELLFDGGIHEPEALLSTFTLAPHEIRQVEFCTLDQVRERCLPGTYRRLAAVLGAPEGAVLYLERGVTPGSPEPLV